MKGFTFIVCFILVLLITAVPVTATTTTIPSTDKINSVSPKAGAEGPTAFQVTITGVNFTTTKGEVWLEQDNDDIAGTIVSWSPYEIVCRFNLKNKDSGEWDVVVQKGEDDTTIVKTGGFAISEEMSITSISPTSGQEDEEVDFTLTGSGFDEDLIKKIFLCTDDYKNNRSADSDFDVKSKTKITGTFDLDNMDEDTYDICIEDDYGVVECEKNEFKVITSAEGTIEISSSPTGATIYIDDIANGTTPRNINILVGSHKVTLKKSGYQDWAKIVNVDEDDPTEIDATLYAVGTATPTPERTATERTATPTTRRTTVKSTIKIPTSYAEPVTTAAESPVDPALIIGSVCLALIALRRR